MSVQDIATKKLLKRKLLKKILIIGEGGVGKTTLIYRYVNNQFLPRTKMTIGSNIFVKKVIETQGNLENHLTMLIWDFAGEKRFRVMLKEFSRGAQAIILAFDLLRIRTLDKLKDWIKLLEDFKLWGNSQIEFFFVGMKKDLLEIQHLKPIPPEIIQDFQKMYFIKKYWETSSATDEGINELFTEIGNSMIEQADNILINSIHEY